MFRRMLLCLAVLCTALSSPIRAQETAPPPDIELEAPGGVVETSSTDTASTPPVTAPTPTEPTVKGWIQAFVNEYALGLLILLSSYVTMKAAQRWPTIAKFDTAMKLAVMFAGSMGIYALIRWAGGTVPNEILSIVVEGLGPAIAAVLVAAGVGRYAKDTKIASTEARLYR